MQIGVPRETAEGERRVALVPEVVGKLKGQGLDVVVERGAGAGALIPDEQYEQAGARMVDDAGAVYESDVVVKVAPPSAEEVERLHSDGVLIGFLAAADGRRRRSGRSRRRARRASRWSPCHGSAAPSRWTHSPARRTSPAIAAR